MTDYNPFGKKVSELEKEDLDKLIGNVAEGWFIEYKGDFPSSTNKISHSLASFANSDGGWYIIGIDDEDGSNIATEIVGFDINVHSMPKEQIRNIIANNITPKPFFESKLIMINNEKAVLVVHIESGDETPYVTNDGKIYQRVGEGSDPIKLNDHYSIQKLYDRSKESRLWIENFSQNRFGISKGQSNQNQCFLEIYFYTMPVNKFEFNDFSSENFFKEVIKNFSEKVHILSQYFVGSIELNNYYSSSSSYILRHITPENSIDLGTTMELFINGNLKVILPVPTISIENLDYSDPDYLEILGDFYELLSENEYQYLEIIDANKFFVEFMVFYKQYIQFLKNKNFNGTLGVRFKITNSWRTLLFFNDENYLNLIREYGCPICLKSGIEIPNFNNGNLIATTLNEEEFSVPLEGEGLEPAVIGIDSIVLLQTIYEALGIPRHFSTYLLPGIVKYIFKFGLKDSNSDNVK
ncbi:AlbA family DNA-binding domain-containing protein [Methanobacterium aggregans]|uniref:AlbA family DNA-binding domain-containing protein n=1 Tax=Methanobacterium aggregans TaxID=1615586 RepID=UPI001AEA4DB1|nr:ATP-binding protein [Methanobacterium aggregans]MBP2045207.1 hypothetical protein [Methanobacterium aggregans]